MSRLRRPDDLLLAGTVTLASALIVSLSPDWTSPVRVLLGFITVLVVPGYTLMTLLFPRTDDVDVIERIVLSLGLSVVAVSLVGLILNYTPWGIRLVPMSLGLLAWVLLTSAASLVRRVRYDVGTQFSPSFRDPAFWQNLLLLGSVCAAVGGIVFLAQWLRPDERYTEFYVLGAEGRLEDYPRNLRPGQPFSLTLGVSNHEDKAQRYLIATKFDQKRQQTPVVGVGRSWEKSIQFTAPTQVGERKLVFDLYQDGEPEVYRSLHLFIEVGPGSGDFFE